MIVFVIYHKLLCTVYVPISCARSVFIAISIHVTYYSPSRGGIIIFYLFILTPFSPYSRVIVFKPKRGQIIRMHGKCLTDYTVMSTAVNLYDIYTS